MLTYILSCLSEHLCQSWLQVNRKKYDRQKEAGIESQGITAEHEQTDTVGDATLFDSFIKGRVIGINSGGVCLCKLQHLVQGIWAGGLESAGCLYIQTEMPR